MAKMRPRKNVCRYIYMYVYIYVYIYACINIYICIHGQDEAQDSQDEAQDGQDEAQDGQDGQDEAQDGQDEAQDGQDEPKIAKTTPKMQRPIRTVPSAPSTYPMRIIRISRRFWSQVGPKWSPRWVQVEPRLHITRLQKQGFRVGGVSKIKVSGNNLDLTGRT